jgi:2,3-bisphosphoglycerate-independent phosphoglycerate mutase
MKYAVLLGDGMADWAVESLGGKTPLEYAKIPNMDRIAREGTIGLIDTVPKGYKPGSDVAILSVLGYDPVTCYTGRGPLEAASMGVELVPGDLAFRCNLVTLGDGPDPVMVDFTAGHISTAEAREIIVGLDQAIGSGHLKFYPGVGYRHLLVWKGGGPEVETTPPHDITGQATAQYLPKGKGAGDVLELMLKSREVLNGHPVNRSRETKGKKKATSIWLWGQGGKPVMEPLSRKFGLSGAMISAVDLLNGLGVYAGLEVLKVEGATGYIDTNYIGKAEKALEALRIKDFVFVHVEAPDEMGHEGNAEGKVKAIEDFDEKVVGTILGGIGSFGDFRVLVLSDHPTPVAKKTHVSEASPFAVLSSVASDNLKNGGGYSENSARKSGIVVSPGWQLMEGFIRDWRRFIEDRRR